MATRNLSYQIQAVRNRVIQRCAIAIAGLRGAPAAPDGQMRIRVMAGPCRGYFLAMPAFERVSYLRGTYESALLERTRSLATDGVIYVVGAHIGYTSLYLAQFVEEVHAFEADPDIFEALKWNIEQNGITNVVAVNKAVSDSDDGVSFVSFDYSLVGHIVEPGDAETMPSDGQLSTLPSTTIDSYVAQGNRPPSLVISTVPDAESLVFLGARQTLSDLRPHVISLVGRPRIARLETVMRDAGYEGSPVEEGRLNMARDNTGYYLFDAPRSETVADDLPDGREPARPLLCIGLPVYNGERFLAEAIESILDQTFGDFELIISDNASTDATPDIVASFLASDSRIKYVRHEVNIGASANFDSVWHRCRSPYFKWMAADDTCSPMFLERCISALDDHPEVGLAYPRTAFIGSDSRTLYAFDQLVTTPDDWATDRFRRTRQVVDVLLRDGSAANVMIFGVIRRDVLRQVTPIGHYFGADLPLVAELVVRAGVVEIGETLSFLRRHGGSSSTYDRSPSAKDQQDFYDPCVRGSLRLQWNLRRRYAALLRVVAKADVGAIRRVGLIGFLFGAIARRFVWRIRFERNVRSGVSPAPLEWHGGPIHWTAVNTSTVKP